MARFDEHVIDAAASRNLHGKSSGRSLRVCQSRFFEGRFQGFHWDGRTLEGCVFAFQRSFRKDGLNRTQRLRQMAVQCEILANWNLRLNVKPRSRGIVGELRRTTK